MATHKLKERTVYNNFPWPQQATAAQKAKVEKCARRVLEVRQERLDKGATLADLYDATAMPGPLLRAHGALDGAVDRCYRAQPFANDRARIEFLFHLYEQLAAPLAPAEQPKKSRRRKKKREGGDV